MSRNILVDLFCGAGGMSTGFEQAGFEVLAAIDNDPHATTIFEKNHSKVEHVFQKNLREFSPKELDDEIGGGTVDVIIGGPPCQGFSTASMNPKARPNYGPNSKHDDRNSLYKRFLDYVHYFTPSAFVMENVPGFRTKANGSYERAVCRYSAKIGYDTEVWHLNAAKYGVPQRRRRIFIVGYNQAKEIGQPSSTHSPSPKDRKNGYISVGDAIMDLPPLEADDGSDEMEYDSEGLNRLEENERLSSSYARWARNDADILRHHVSRPHLERDLKIFDMIKTGSSSAQLSPEEQELIPYNMDSFKDKYRRQPLLQPATTVTAHIAKDGLYYIHPVQRRSLTPREAARLQSFKDTYTFSKYRTPTYRLIGNAVPPLLAEAIARRVVDAI